MAITNQKLINFHGSNRSDAAIQSALTKGEIAILHAGNAEGTMIGTLNDNGNLVWFISSAAVWTAIAAVDGGQTEQLDALKTAVSCLSSSTITIENNLASVSAATKPMLTAVTMSVPTTDAVAGNYIEFTTAITGDDYNKVETIGTTLDVIQTAAVLSAVTATGQVADALAIRQYVEGVDTGIQGQITSINNDIDELSSSTVTLEDRVDKALDGLTIDDNNSIKTYVDSAISTTISSVYRYKGTKETYAALPASGNEVGDVWNVVSAATVGGEPYPAGTNWVWTGTEWDALGGTVDLSPFVTNDEFTPVKQKAESALQGISGYSSNDYITLTNKAAVTDHNSAFTITQNVATSFGSIASTTKQVADAYGIQEYVKTMKNEAVTSAYTASSAITYNAITDLQNQVDGIDTRVLGIENSSVFKSAVTAVTFDELTSGATGVVGGTNTNRQESGVAAKIANKTLTLDFDCLVIDCGTF